MNGQVECARDIDKDGMTVEEALQYHAGWQAAKKGEPRNQPMPAFWRLGYIEFLWWASAPQSWRRH